MQKDHWSFNHLRLMIGDFTYSKAPLMDKCITNQTSHDISVTLYVAELKNTELETKEIHTIDIPSMGYKEIQYGILKNSFISGIKISAIINGVKITNAQQIKNIHNQFSDEVNKKFFIEIKGVEALEIELF